jgi:hypothetical protein
MNCVAPDAVAQMAQLWDLVAGDGQLTLRVQVDPAGVLQMQLIEFRADLAPDARLLGVVIDQRRAEVLQPVLATQSEQLLAPLDVPFVPQTGVPRLQLQRGHIRRRDHGVGVEGEAVFGQACRWLLHGWTSLEDWRAPGKFDTIGASLRSSRSGRVGQRGDHGRRPYCSELDTPAVPA